MWSTGVILGNQFLLLEECEVHQTAVRRVYHPDSRCVIYSETTTNPKRHS